VGTQAPALQGELILYVRRGCHLCTEAEEILAPLLARAGRTLRREDVDRDPEARRLYGERVPVLVCGGRVLCWGRFQPAACAALFGWGPGRRRRWPWRAG
jgi:glutaredoxin